MQAGVPGISSEIPKLLRHVKFMANVRDEQLSWELDYKPASETAEDFIHKVKAKLLDTLNNYCDIAL